MDTLFKIEREGLRADLPMIQAGDTIKVHTRLKEAEREHVQIFEGVVIKLAGSGIRKSCVVRKISYGVGVERIFPLYSPAVAKIELVSRGQVRRAKLYYLRDLAGRKARLKSAGDFERLLMNEGPSVEAQQLAEEVTTKPSTDGKSGKVA